MNRKNLVLMYVEIKENLEEKSSFICFLEYFFHLKVIRLN